MQTASAQEVHMQVKNRLSRLRPHVEHRAIAILDAALACDMGGSQMTAANQFGVLGRSFF